MDIFDEYERRFAEARAEKVQTKPWEPKTREDIIAATKRIIRYDEKLIPQIHDMQEISRKEYDGYCAIQLRYQTWDRVYGVSTLYLPNEGEKLPLNFVCCGHGEFGRLSESYFAMGHRLASLGIAALVMDNLGQGDRNLTYPEPKGPDHWFANAPFYCDLTMQGLIVMETIGLIRYMKNDPRFDPDRFTACGNSGGGTLTMFLAALAPELSAIASCGYPNEATYVLQKERRHCCCNMLIGQAHEVEMWEMYSIFAPKPLMLSSGMFDQLLPVDLFQKNSRKVRNTYVQLGADENFSSVVTRTKHTWEVLDTNAISKFLCNYLFGTTPEDAEEMYYEKDISPFHVELPADRLTTTELCEMLSGKKVPEGIELADVFPPTYQGKPIDPEQIQLDVGRGDVMRVFAQFECTLHK